MGGRWISERLRLRPGKETARDVIRMRVREGLEQKGWVRKPPNSRVPYVLSKIWDTAPDDLYYSHARLEGDPENWSYAQAVHVSADGREVHLYREVVW